MGLVADFQPVVSFLIKKVDINLKNLFQSYSNHLKSCSNPVLFFYWANVLSPYPTDFVPPHAHPAPRDAPQPDLKPSKIQAFDDLLKTFVTWHSAHCDPLSSTRNVPAEIWALTLPVNQLGSWPAERTSWKLRFCGSWNDIVWIFQDSFVYHYCTSLSLSQYHQVLILLYFRDL